MKVGSKTANKESSLEDLALKLLNEENRVRRFNNYTATSQTVLKFVAAGAFIVSSVIAPNILKLAKPLVRDLTADESWKRYNIPYLKRKLRRLEKQKLVKFYEEGTKQVVEITSEGRKRILKFALNEMEVHRPISWNKQWWLVTYDIPGKNKELRASITEYLKLWGFYPLEQSVYLHAYPCAKEIRFLREYLGVGEYLRIFTVSKIENDQIFRDFFGI